MKRLVWIALGLVALGAVVGLSLRTGAEHPATPPAEADSPRTATTVAPSAGAPDERRSQAAVEGNVPLATHDPAPEPAPDSGCSLSGVVRDPRANPAGGVKVRCYAWRWGRPLGEAKGAADSRADGTFRVDGLEAERTYLVIADAPSGCARVITEPRDGVVLTLRGGAHLVGVVRDERGAPLEHVLVLVDRPPVVAALKGPMAARYAGSATTTVTGAFSCRGIAPGRHLVHFRPRNGIGRTTQREVEYVEGKTTRLEVTLRSGVALAGTVVDARGNAISGASIVDGNNPGRVVRSDASGAFRMDGQSPKAWMLQVSAPGVMTTMVAARHHRGEKSLRIVLQDPVEITGVVVDTDGAPCAGAAVAVVRSITSEIPNTAVTGADGRFALAAAGVFPGAARYVAIRRAGYGRVLQRIRIARDLDMGRVVLAAAAEVRVAVVDVDGNALAGIEVEVRTGGRLARVAITDERGDARFGELTAGRTTVAARGAHSGPHADFIDAEQTTSIEAGRAATVRLVMARGRAITGTATTVDGRPIESATVVAAARAWRVTRSTTTDRLGQFRLGGLPESDGYQLDVHHARFASASANAKPGQSILVQMKPLVRLHGTIQRTDGIASWISYGVVAGEVATKRMHRVRTIDDGTENRFELWVPAGRYALTATSPTAVCQPRDVTVQGRATEVNLVPERAMELRVRVGGASARTRASLMSGLGGASRALDRVGAGAFHLDGLAAGRYLLRATDLPRELDRIVPVSLLPGGPTTVDVDLRPRGHLVCSVTRDARPVAGATVTVAVEVGGHYRSIGRRKGYATDDDGRSPKIPLPEGEYRFSVNLGDSVEHVRGRVWSGQVTERTIAVE